MSPPVAIDVSRTSNLMDPVSLKENLGLGGVNGLVEIKDAGGTTEQIQDYDVLEDYDGKYRFAPIEEAEVSRAMIKRYVYAKHAYHHLPTRQKYYFKCVDTLRRCMTEQSQTS